MPRYRLLHFAQCEHIVLSSTSTERSFRCARFLGNKNSYYLVESLLFPSVKIVEFPDDRSLNTNLASLPLFAIICSQISRVLSKYYSPLSSFFSTPSLTTSLSFVKYRKILCRKNSFFLLKNLHLLTLLKF